MHHYAFHIGDFRSATTYFSRLERAMYREMLDLIYDTEAPLPKDITKLYRLLSASQQDERDAIDFVLSEKFELTEEGYTNKRAVAEIQGYKRLVEVARKAGKASALKRNSTPVERPLNDRCVSVEPTSNHKPVTSNQEPDLKPEKKEITQDHGVPSPQADITTTPFFEFARQMRSDLEAEATARGLNWVLPTDSGLRSWANQIRLAVVANGRTLDELKVIWKWARQDSFWADNIRSAEKLRKQFDTLVLHKNKPKPSPSYTNPIGPVNQPVRGPTRRSPEEQQAMLDAIKAQNARLETTREAQNA